MLAPDVMATRAPARVGRVGGDVLLEPGDCEGARRLDDGARVLEDVLDGGADLVRGHLDHLVDEPPASRKSPRRRAWTAAPSAKMPTSSSATRFPVSSDSYMPSASSGSTPMILTCGAMRLM